MSTNVSDQITEELKELIFERDLQDKERLGKDRLSQKKWGFKKAHAGVSHQYLNGFESRIFSQ
jgi:hypothetical protein